MAQSKSVADYDEVLDHLADIEKGLGIKCDKGATLPFTLGEAFDKIWEAAAVQTTRGGRCPTAASYYLIKRLVQNRHAPQVLTPSTRLKDIEGFQYATVRDALQRNGWSAPVRDLTFHTICLALTSATTGAGLAHLSNGFTLTVLWFGIFAGTAWASHRWLFRRGMPDGCKTLGDLAYALARQNLKRLRTEGATGLNRKITYGMLAQGVGSVEPSAVLTWD